MLTVKFYWFDGKTPMDHLAQTGAFELDWNTRSKMRIIASWLLSRKENPQKPQKVTQEEERGGREDKVLAGIILANVGISELNKDPWVVLVKLFREEKV